MGLSGLLHEDADKRNLMKKKAFTLIELLVVIAIIAILAAILFPVFTKAKAAAKKTQDLSNMKQLGVAVQMYLADNDDIYPMAYYYVNGANSSNGYVHWSGMIYPYVKNWDLFRSPGDDIRGFAPTNFIGDNMGYGAPAGQVSSHANIQDVQAPRLSYISNELIFARKKYAGMPNNVVPSTIIPNVAADIILAPRTDSISCQQGTLPTGGDAVKSHRPTSGIMLTPTGGVVDTENPAHTGISTYAVTVEIANQQLADCRITPSANYVRLTYSQPDRWDNGANFVFADTHAKFKSLSATLDPNNFLWGKSGYTIGNMPVLDQSGVPVR